MCVRFGHKKRLKGEQIEEATVQKRRKNQFKEREREREREREKSLESTVMIVLCSNRLTENKKKKDPFTNGLSFWERERERERESCLRSV